MLGMMLLMLPTTLLIDQPLQRREGDAKSTAWAECGTGFVEMDGPGMMMESGSQADDL